MGPKMYRKQLSEIGIEDMEIQVSSIKRAMETLHKLDDLEEILKKIKHNLRTDMRKLRIDYMRKIQDLDELSHKKSLLGRRMSPEKVIEKKKSLIKERKNNIAVYEIIENMIDGYLTQIEESRYYIRNHIEGKVR